MDKLAFCNSLSRADGAVGIENTYVMEDDGPKVLTHAKEEIICV